MKMYGRVLMVLVVCLGFASNATAAPVLNAENGHYYDIVGFYTPGSTPYSTMPQSYVINDLSPWSYANGFTSSMSYNGLSAHLATLTSSSEDMFVLNLIRSRNAGDSFLGGYKTPSGSWAWVTGEQWSYTRWGGGEPNNYIAEWTDSLGEQYLMARMINDGWNDHRSISGNFVIEYEAGTPAPTPIPGAVWLLGSGLVGLMGFKRTRRSSPLA